MYRKGNPSQLEFEDYYLPFADKLRSEYRWVIFSKQIAWHHKYAGVLRLFKQEHRVCNVEELRFGDLVEKFKALWNDREQITKTITRFLPDVKDQIAAAATEIYNIVSEKSN